MPGPILDFAVGWLPPDPECNTSPADARREVVVCRGNAWGRPVDVVVGPDGALFVSDDLAGAIYRIVYAP